MRVGTVVQVAAMLMAVALVVGGGFAIYYLTLPPSNVATAASNPTTSESVRGGMITVSYNGTSYQVPAKGPNSPSFPCPAGTAPSLCNLLQQTCGNGVGPGNEPWKTCSNCVFDAGCTGDLSCDPYTHECSTPATACMVAVYQSNG